MANRLHNYWRDLDDSASRYMTPVIKWLIYICVAVFILQIFAQPIFRGRFDLETFFGTSPYWTLLKLHLWQLITYMFLHGGVGHLFVNMLGLWFFGTRIEERWGSGRFIRFALVTGVGAALTHLLVSYMFARNPFELAVPMIGISGVCYGIMLAFAMYYPDDLIYVYAIFPVKAKILVTVMAIMVLLGSINGPGGGVAHLGHLGGLIFGFLFVRYPDVFDRIPLPRFGARRRNTYRYHEGGRGRWRDF